MPMGMGMSSPARLGERGWRCDGGWRIFGSTGLTDGGSVVISRNFMACYENQ